MERSIRLRRAMTTYSAVAFAAVLMAAPTPISSQAPDTAMVERGAYLVRITGCHDCHSPKVQGMEPDLSRALSGRPASTPLPSPATDEIHASADLTAWQGPWGYTVASNLTPDPATGLGSRYSEATFITAMRTGRKPNGTMIQPPMPSDVYQNMTDDDLKAIFAYLRTITPIRNAVMAGLPAPGTQKP